MIRALFSAASGMFAQELNIDTISNNIANIKTTGFKKNRVEFQDVLYQTLKVAGSPVTQENVSPTGIQVGLGVRPSSTQKSFSQGSFERSDNPLDIAIEGDGFFQIQTCDGSTQYSRDGAFKVDANGRMVTADGNFLVPSITIPPEAQYISIGQDGTVSVITNDSASPQQVGQITLARFVNPPGLIATGQNLFQQSAASGPPSIGTPGCDSGFGRLQQGFLEFSNVKIVEELVNMIIAQRAFEANSKAVKAADDMLGEAVNLRR